jgi:hypothetical protein
MTEDIIGTGSEGKDLPEPAQGTFSRTRAGIGAEVERPIIPGTADEDRPGIFLTEINPEIAVGLIIPEINIIFRPILLDQVVLQYQSLFLGIGNQIVKIRRPGHQGGNPGTIIPRSTEIVQDPTPEIPGLPDIENLPRRIFHQINSRKGRKRFNFFF